LRFSAFSSKALATFPDIGRDTFDSLDLRDSSASEDIGQQMEILAAELEGVTDIAGMLDKLWLLIKNHSSPVIKGIVFFIILPYMISIFANLHTPFYENWWREFTGINLRQEAKEVRSLANEKFTHEQLKGLRFVSAQNLDVHSESRLKSKIEDTLSFGQVVRIIVKKKGWAFIEYHDDETGEMKSGWVLLRFGSTLH
jgi:hypothetical protein